MEQLKFFIGSMQTHVHVQVPQKCSFASLNKHRTQLWFARLCQWHFSCVENSENCRRRRCQLSSVRYVKYSQTHSLHSCSILSL